MKSPLINIFRTSKVFAVVLGLHLFVLSLLLFHPGCQRGGKTPSEGSSAPMGEVTSLDNATLAEPTRPADDTTTSTVVSGVNDVPAYTTTSPSVVSTEAPPAPVASETSYIVKKGDSLWSIARHNGVTIGALLEANNLNRNSVLKVGQTIKIPAATTTPVNSSSVSSSTSSSLTPSTEASSTTSIVAGTTYVVKSGDSLGKISRASGISVRALKAANKLHSNTIRVGQKLKIPSKGEAATLAKHSSEKHAAKTVEKTEEKSADSSTSSSNDSSSTTTSADGYTTHKVEAGESPAVIAHKYGMKTSELVSLNNITDPRKLRVGQELKVKSTSLASSETSSVAAGTDGNVTTGSNAVETTMSVQALEAATSTTTSADAAAPVVEVKPASTLSN